MEQEFFKCKSALTKNEFLKNLNPCEKNSQMTNELATKSLSEFQNIAKNPDRHKHNKIICFYFLDKVNAFYAKSDSMLIPSRVGIPIGIRPPQDLEKELNSVGKQRCLIPRFTKQKF